MVKDVGVARTYVRFHWNVMGLEGAILKKDVEDWGGCRNDRIPAGASVGMFNVLDDDPDGETEPDADTEPDTEPDADTEPDDDAEPEDDADPELEREDEPAGGFARPLR